MLSDLRLSAGEADFVQSRSEGAFGVSSVETGAVVSTDDC
jgi:hypothetical protein